MRFHLIFLISLGFSFARPVLGQDELLADTTFLNMSGSTTFFISKSTSDPNKAALLSAILPGLGQAYNRQYWKIPIIYTAGIVMTHYIRYNNEIYNAFRTGLVAETDSRDDTINPFNEVIPGRYNQNTLELRRDYFRRNRDYLMIIGGVMYLLNIAEAHIAAHLKEFDINDGLTMKLQPSIQPTPLFSHATGISLRFRF